MAVSCMAGPAQWGGVVVGAGTQPRAVRPAPRLGVEFGIDHCESENSVQLPVSPLRNVRF